MKIKTVQSIEAKSFVNMVYQVNYFLENYHDVQWNGLWQVHDGVFYTTVYHLENV